jgi:hypothetical protein
LTTRRAWIPSLVAPIVFVVFAPVDAAAVAERIVVIKADGLPFEVVDRLVREKAPYTGKSLLPWIDHVFYKNGARLSNFYSRGLSLSAPSWAILDTGQHSLIKGNLEFDRLTLDSYDYLNIFSFVLKNSAGHTTDTAAARLLDEYGVPLVSDAYPASERHLSAQIIARGLKSVSLVGGLRRLLTLQTPKEWVDEWTIGLDAEALLFEVLEREFLTKLRNPQIRYLDFLVPFFDHAAHTSREPEAQLHALQKIDAVVKRIWTAIQESGRNECRDGSSHPRLCAARCVVVVREVFLGDEVRLLRERRLWDFAPYRISHQGVHESTFLRQVVPDRVCFDGDRMDTQAGAS